MDFKVTKALGKYLIVEAQEKSTVLRAEEISTVFKVTSIGCLSDFGGVISADLSVDDLIIVRPGSIEKTMMGHQEIYCVLDTDVIAKVSSND